MNWVYMQILRGALPPCVWHLVNHIDKDLRGRKGLCPNDAYGPLLYHLGHVFPDTVLLQHGAQHAVVQLLIALKLAPGEDIVVTREWDSALGESAPILQTLLCCTKAKEGVAGVSRFSSSAFTASAAVLTALAPLLQHLLHLSFRTTDLILGRDATFLLAKALGVTGQDIWLSSPQHSGRKVKEADAQRLATQIRELLSGPCLGTLEGVQGTDPTAYVDNQHQLSSSRVYHTVYRDVPQYGCRDAADGMSLASESRDKCHNPKKVVEKLSEDERVSKAKHCLCGMLSFTCSASRIVFLSGYKNCPADKPQHSYLQRRRLEAGMKRTDGIMVVTCKHLVVYYYHVLLQHESVRDVFTFLCTRFLHRPPRFIIYDNACALDRYCRGVSCLFFKVVRVGSS